MKPEKLQFDLLESLLWTPEDGYFLLQRHIDRLLRSVEYFGMAVGKTAVVDALMTETHSLTEPSKVRLTVNSEQLTVNSVSLSDGVGQLPEPIRIGLAIEPIQSDNVYLYHKTTQRQVYAEALASRPDCDDVVLWNERGEVTEVSSSNIVVELGGELWTPPVSSGLLAGTFREELLENGLRQAQAPLGQAQIPQANGRLQEKVILKDELLLADAIFLINSVRGWRTAKIIDK
ncbi:MAG: aminotransferase class IV [Anaerolineae bacterium]|nr:aminotransferase class IV [Anaerolineae bacterium]